MKATAIPKIIPWAPLWSPFMGDLQEKNVAADTVKWEAKVYNDYAGLEGIWRKMESGGHCTVFQTYDWASCWYDTAVSCGEAEPLIVVVTGRDKEPAWILPLCLYRKKGLRIISFADHGISDYAAPVIASGAPLDKGTFKAIIKAVLNTLPPCDVIDFQKLTSEIEGIPNPLLMLNGLQRFPVNCHGIHLYEPWPVLKTKIMQTRMRSNIRRRKKLIREEGDIHIKCYNCLKSLTPLMDKIITMRNRRFLEIGRFEMPCLWQKFYQNLTAGKGGKLNIVITTMTVSGELVAACFGLIKGHTYYAIMPTFEMGKWKRYSPGLLLFDAMITSFSEQSGEGSYFDFTVGDELYKKHMGGSQRPLYEWMLPRSLAGLIAYLFWRLKSVLRHVKLLQTLKSLRQFKIKNSKVVA